MVTERIFPFERMEKNSKVILYGAGKVSREYIQQNEKLQWCDILFAVDINGSSITNFPISVYLPQYISNIVKYDYILIAIASIKKRNDAKKLLLQLGIPKDKIIDEIDCFYWDRDGMIKNQNETNLINNSQLRIGIIFTGGLGDQIMQLCIYQQLVEIDKDCIIDIIVPQKRMEFAKCIFFHQARLGKIKEWDMSERDYNVYSIVLKLDFEIEIVKFDLEYVKKKSHKLAKKILQLQNYNKYEFLGLPVNTYSSRMKIDRAKFEGKNHYTMYNCNNIFNIVNQKVKLEINEVYVEQFKQLKLGKRYCTYNYGADDVSGNGKLQTKLWPYKYHERFNQLFKKVFPTIELVQLGGKNATKIPYADRYILGERLEIVEHILKNSLLHIDCEGGLVHLATQLETKCCVLFGPTPAWFYGYPQNINIESTVCGECIYMYQDWFTCCHRNGKAECMKSITPQIVMEKIKQYLDLEQ